MQISRAWRYWRSSEVGGGIEGKLTEVGVSLKLYGCVREFALKPGVEPSVFQRVGVLLVLARPFGGNWAGGPC